MNSEFMVALSALETEKGISKEVVLDAIETALVSAYKRDYGQNANARVSINRESGEVKLYALKTVVDTVESPNMEISLEDAVKINPLYELGDVIEQEMDTDNFGRITTMTAKQVVMQRIREAERGLIMDEFSEKENEALTAIVQHHEKNGVLVELGKTDGFIPQSECMAGETYEKGKHLKVYIIEVKATNRGPQILVSRTHPGLVKRLFEFEVPEIASGAVQIRSIAREAGSRTKISVSSANPQVDAVGSCVGQRGARVENIVRELNNEKIDIIEWDPDPAIYIAKSLSPAKVLMVYINEEEKAAKVLVPDNQLSLAIGREGQNARLAARLTGWKIDIKSQSQSEKDMDGMDGFFGDTEERTEASGRNVFEELSGVFDMDTDESADFDADFGDDDAE